MNYENSQNNSVKVYLEEIKAKERKLYEEEKQQYLFEVGFFEKEYLPRNCAYNPEYPFYDDREEAFFKKLPIYVSDEEYEELKKHTDAFKNKTEHSSNPIASALKFIAVLSYIGGIIYFLISCIAVSEGDMEDMTMGSIMLGVALIEGTMFLGFAEIIRLLHKLTQKK